MNSANGTIQGKCIINKNPIFGSQSRLRDSKPRNNALHAFCGIETIELPLRSSHKKSVFEPRPAPSRQHYGKTFIMRKPCGTIHFNLSFSQNSIYLRVRLRERFVNPQLLKQLAVYKIKESISFL